jgi:hypothetical protein
MAIGDIGAEYVYDICNKLERKASDKCHELMHELYDDLLVEIEKVRTISNTFNKEHAL